MIPVRKKPEPAEFDSLVRRPGRAYLRQVRRPSSKQFQEHAYWTRIQSHLRERYGGICAYAAFWIPPTTGSANVEHFIPKSRVPRLAYEWDNYRFVCGRLNGRKGDFVDVIDPFVVRKSWFYMDFPSLLLKPNPSLSAGIKAKVVGTISRLKLNDDDTLIKERNAWLRLYCIHGLTFRALKENAPFIATELERQGLTHEAISAMMAYPQ